MFRGASSKTISDKPIPGDTEGEPPFHVSNDRPSLAGRLSRRSFLTHLGAAGIAATAPPILGAPPPAASPVAAPEAATVPVTGNMVPLTLRVNGEAH
jgi:hypothetical protein